ncbi:hypothetical protein D9756_008174 [Leucocoprinus leucothites]|uniref:Uncharacterized protein n=1 Tax=Leucocoprinus leucothites TaxID=201217 RepID=A0A8H5FV91_9AGAR|nr:hypothetical protein D9756_008174 [Leucoagaricus leucothites]
MHSVNFTNSSVFVINNSTITHVSGNQVNYNVSVKSSSRTTNFTAPRQQQYNPAHGPTTPTSSGPAFIPESHAQKSVIPVRIQQSEQNDEGSQEHRNPLQVSRTSGSPTRDTVHPVASGAQSLVITRSTSSTAFRASQAAPDATASKSTPPPSRWTSTLNIANEHGQSCPDTFSETQCPWDSSVYTTQAPLSPSTGSQYHTTPQMPFTPGATATTRITTTNDRSNLSDRQHGNMVMPHHPYWRETSPVAPLPPRNFHSQMYHSQASEFYHPNHFEQRDQRLFFHQEETAHSAINASKNASINICRCQHTDPGCAQ